MKNLKAFTFFLPADNKEIHATPAPVVAVTLGELGYTPIFTNATADDLNKQPLPPEVAEAALIGSMFGWGVPGARPAVEWVDAPGNVRQRLKRVVQDMQFEILSDMMTGVVPRNIESFAELHDYVDANCYGGFCDDPFADELIELFGGRDADYGLPQGFIDFMNSAQDAVDEWLKTEVVFNRTK